MDTRLSGRITEMDTKLSGRITELDARLTGRLDQVVLAVGDLRGDVIGIGQRLDDHLVLPASAAHPG